MPDGSEPTIDDLLAKQDIVLAERRRQELEEQQKIARKQQAGEKIAEIKRLHDETRKLDQSAPDISTELIKQNQTKQEELGQSKQEKTDILTTARNDLVKEKAKLQKIQERLKDVPQEFIISELKIAIDEINSEITKLSSAIAQTEHDLSSIDEQESRLKANISEAERLLLDVAEKNASARELAQMPEVHQELHEQAETENEIRSQFADRFTREIMDKLNKRKRDERNRGFEITEFFPKEVEDYYRGIVQQYLEEEIKRRGIDQLPEEESIAKLRTLVDNLSVVLGKDIYPHDLIERYANDSRLPDFLRGQALKQLLGAGPGSPVGALDSFAKAAALENGESATIQFHNLAIRVEENETRIALRNEILAHKETFDRIKVLARAEERVKFTAIYPNQEDWNRATQGIGDKLVSIKINYHGGPTIDLESARSASAESEKQQEEYEKKIVKAEEMVRAAQEFDLDQKRKERQRLIERKKELEAELENLHQMEQELENLKKLPSWGLTEEEQARARGLKQQVEDKIVEYNIRRNAEPSIFTINKSRFYDERDEAAKALYKEYELLQQKLDDLNAAPEKRAARIAEISNKLEDRGPQKVEQAILYTADLIQQLDYYLKPKEI